MRFCIINSDAKTYLIMLEMFDFFVSFSIIEFRELPHIRNYLGISTYYSSRELT